MTTHNDTLTATGWPRALVRFGPTALLTVVHAHAFGGLLARLPLAPAEPTLWALPLTLGALLVATFAAATSPTRARPVPALGAAGFSIAALCVVSPAAGMAGLALLPLALAAAALSAAIGRRLPADVDGFASQRPLPALLWAGVTLLCVLQFARLATWVSNPESDWFLTTREPFWSKHECLSAYLYGAELGLRGEDNLYDAAHYPGLNPDATPHSEMAPMVVEDPFQYAPPFLLLPAAAVSLTHHYPTVRAFWFALQTTGFLAAAAWLALWIGGRIGRQALWLLPLALSAFPVLHSLQYGQFHLAAVALGVTAMIAFERKRHALGGAMLAVATLSKVFPGVLLLVLVAQRRTRELLWTAGFGAALSVATVAVFGTAPVEAFVHYHLPRLQSGDAFAFGEAWPELRELLLAANHGVYGVVMKLAELGVPGLDAGVAVQVNRAYGVLLALLALFVGSRAGQLDRAQSAVAWLSLVGLASMMSTGAFADYVPLTATWLLTLLVSRMARPRTAVLLGTAWLFQYALLFVAPLGSWFDPAIFLPLSTASTLMMLALLAWAVGVTLREANLAAHRRPRLEHDRLADAGNARPSQA